MDARRGDAADALLAARAEHWPQAVTPVAHLMVRVFRVGSLVLDHASRRLAGHALTLKEFDVLATLRGTPPPHELVPTELYEAALISSGGLTKVLHALEERGLVVRSESRTDRRSRPVRLTAKGRTLAERALADVLRSDAALLGEALSDAEVDRLARLLRKLLVTLEARGPDGA